MLRRITPAAICPPLANYSHAVEVPPNARWLYVSGQLGIAPDGTVPGSCAEQAEACFANLLAILAEAGMGAGDLVRLNTYLIDAGDRAAYMAVRDRHVASRLRRPPCWSCGAGATGVQDRDRGDRRPSGSAGSIRACARLAPPIARGR